MILKIKKSLVWGFILICVVFQLIASMILLDSSVKNHGDLPDWTGYYLQIYCWLQFNTTQHIVLNYKTDLSFVYRYYAATNEPLFSQKRSDFLDKTTEDNVLDLLFPNEERPFDTEEERLVSFSEIPGLQQQLAPLFAKRGFFYTGYGDIVECYECHLQLSNWPKSYIHIDLNHKIYSPLCPLVANINIPYQDNIVVDLYLSKPNPLVRDEEGNTLMYLHLAVPVGRKVVRLDHAAPVDPPITCYICYDDEASNVFLPCGHLGLCRDCRHGYEVQRGCPYCMETISGFIRIDRVSPLCVNCGQESDVFTLPCFHNCLCRNCVASQLSCPVCEEDITKRHRMYMNIVSFKNIN